MSSKKKTRKNWGPEKNAERAVHELTRRGPQTRTELASRLEINAATLERALERLVEYNDPHDTIFQVDPSEAQLPEHVVGKLSSAPGRTPEVLMLGRRAGAVVGIEIGHGHLSVSIGDANACLLGKKMIREEDHAINETPLVDTTQRIAGMVKEQLEHCNVNPSEIRGVAISIPAPIDTNGKTLAEGVLTHYDGVNIPNRFSMALKDIAGIPGSAAVTVENDVDTLARGEQRYGKAFELRDFAVVKCSGGIGSAMVSNERLVRGSGGGGVGEIGHCAIKPHTLVTRPNDWLFDYDPKCSCGWWGHLEAFAGGKAIIERIDRLSEGNGALPDGVPLSTQLDFAMNCALEGKAPYAEVIADAAALIGLAVNSLIHIFNPERVLIAGKLSEMGESFLEGIHEECNAHGILFGEVDEIIELGTGTDTAERRLIGVRGAVATALRKTDTGLRYS